MAREFLFDFVEYDRGEAAKCLNCAFTTDTGFARNRARQADERRLVAEAEALIRHARVVAP